MLILVWLKATYIGHLWTVANVCILYGCTTWTFINYSVKKLGGNYIRMLHVVLNKPWKQHPTKQQLTGYLLLISQTIQIRWARHAGQCWGSVVYNTYTNTGRLFRFGYERFINSWTPVHGDTRRETQFLKAYANHTMLISPQQAAHLVMFKISIYLCQLRSEKLNRRPQR